MDADALLAATYRGDTKAFDALVRSQAARLHRIASRVTGDASLADDVLQVTFIRMLRVPPTARPSRAAAAWLARVTVRVALNLLESERARRRREARYATERSQKMNDDSSSRLASSADLDRPVAAALASLSPETRAALWLHVVEGEGVREVAACLETSRSAVSRRIRAGLESLRTQLGPSGAALAGAGALRGALQGSDAPPPHALVQSILEAGWASMGATTPSAAPGATDALDAALAAQARSATSHIAIAAAVIAGVLAITAGVILLRPDSAAQLPPALPIAGVPPASPGAFPPAPAGDPPPAELAPPAPAPEAPGAVVSGTVRNESGEPVAGALVYLAMSPPAGADPWLARGGAIYDNDYFSRDHFHQARTDDQGRYRLEAIPDAGWGRLGIFKDGHGDPHGVESKGQPNVSIESGAAQAFDLVLPEGQTLAGRVRTAAGAPIADAVVSVTTAWTSSTHVFWPAGLAPTDADGRFQLGVDAGGAGCHLRVNSLSHGQDFFFEVPVGGGEVELVMKEPARVEGRITWEDGMPAVGLSVRLHGTLPEPPVAVERLGLRHFAVHDSPVAADGSYTIGSLHAQVAYEVLVVDASLAPREEARRNSSLTPREAGFRLQPGEVKAWDRSVALPITLRGRVRTAASGTPVKNAQIGVRKDGTRVQVGSVRAGADGAFELRLTTGPGEYRIHAGPPIGLPYSEHAEDLIDAEFGRTVSLTRGGEAAVDLAVFEPAVLSVRVLDAHQNPAANVQARLNITFPNGQNYRHESAAALDESGRTAFVLYYPAAEVWCEVSARSGGPAVATARREVSPGAVLSEETLVLPRTCGLTAKVVDPAGNPHARHVVRLRIRYADGASAHLATRTDDDGRLDEDGLVRAAGFLAEVLSTDSQVLWTSGPRHGSQGEAVDLGTIVIEAR